jgi:hypothetical protein
LGCTITVFFSSTVILSFPPLESKLLGGKCLTYIGTKGIPLASPSEAILKFLSKNEMVTNQQARDITGIRSENLVKIEFYKLADRGLLERVPGLKGPKSAWQLTEKGREEVGELAGELTT